MICHKRKNNDDQANTKVKFSFFLLNVMGLFFIVYDSIFSVIVFKKIKTLKMNA